MDAERLRERMVRDQVERRGIRDPALLHALRVVPRELFVPPKLVARAYQDSPLPLSQGQTISQPYIVAYMTEQLRLSGEEKVLEIGTGSGYQTAVLSLLSREVYSLEISWELAQEARERLEVLGYANVTVRMGDGSIGWPGEAPFDRILVTAAPPRVPEDLVQQLAPGGRMVLPVGPSTAEQVTVLVTKRGSETRCERLLPVRFVPMTGAVSEES